MNDLAPNIGCDAVCIFADNTSIINKGATDIETKEKIQMSLADASDWFSTNDRLLNRDKSQKLTFCSKSNIPETSS